MNSFMFKPAILAFALCALISSTEGQSIPTCSTTSPQCCWVIRVWRLLGRSTTASPISPTGCCSMAGVYCSGSSVTMISWAQFSLTGSIPSDIGNVRDLTDLLLYSNQLTGSIPSNIGNLRNLRNLYLNGNQLSGSIPSTLGSLTNLRKMDLSRNQLSGSIPTTIGNLVNLLRLELSYNKLTGAIPAEIGNLVNLYWLYLDVNQLSGSIPSTLVNFRGLYILNLARNSLSGPVPSAIGSIPNLEVLALNQNTGLSGTVTAPCGVKAYVSIIYKNSYLANTGVNLCGCASSRSPAVVFPSASTPSSCLRTNPTLTLSKRILAFSQNVGTERFTCNTDENSNPFQDCLNAMSYLCHSTYTGTDSVRINNCRTAVDTMVSRLNTHWQRVRRDCGQWAWNGVRGDFASSNCANSNAILRNSAYYIMPDGSRYNIDSRLTESVRLALWGNTALRR